MDDQQATTEDGWAPAGGVLTSTPSQPAGPLQGVFVSWEPSALARYEAWLGRPADAVLTYTGTRGWWDADPSWIMGQYPGHDHLFSIPLVVDDDTMANVAAGGADQHFRAFAQEILAAHAGDPAGKPIYVRTGWEVGGEWYRWTSESQNDPRVFIDAFRHFSEVFKGVEGGERFRIVWDMACDRGDRTKFYPGDDVVDVVSQDLYWNPQWDGEDPNAAWQKKLDGGWTGFGLEDLQAFAAAHGKPMAISEWGVPAGHDGTDYIRALRAWIDDPTNNVKYATYWDNDYDFSGKMSDGSDPASGATYHALFGP